MRLGLDLEPLFPDAFLERRQQPGIERRRPPARPEPLSPRFARVAGRRGEGPGLEFPDSGGHQGADIRAPTWAATAAASAVGW